MLGPDQNAERSAKMERLAVPLSRELVELIDDFRYANRIPSRSEAIRQLIERGLRVNGFNPPSRP